MSQFISSSIMMKKFYSAGPRNIGYQDVIEP